MNSSIDHSQSDEELVSFWERNLNVSLLGRGAFPSRLTDDEKRQLLQADLPTAVQLCEEFAATRQVVI